MKKINSIASFLVFLILCVSFSVFAEDTIENNAMSEYNINVMSTDVDITTSLSGLEKITNANTNGLLTFYFSKSMDEASLTTANIKIKKNGVNVDYQPYSKVADKYTIDMSILSSMESYTITFSNLVTNGGEAVSERTILFTTDMISPLPHKDNKIIQNVALGKTSVKALDKSVTNFTNGIYENGITTEKKNTLEKGDWVIVDLGAKYEIAAYGWIFEGICWWWVGDLTFFGTNEYPDKLGSDRIFQITSDIAKITLPQGTYAMDSMEEYRYIIITSPTFDTTYSKEFFMWAYVDDVFGNWTLPDVTGISEYTISIPVEHLLDMKTYSMVNSAYDSNGKMVAVNIERVSRNSNGRLVGSIIVPEEATSISAALFDNTNSLKMAVQPATRGNTPYENEEITLSGTDFAEFSVSEMKLGIKAIGEKRDVVNVTVVTGADKSDTPENYFNGLGDNLEKNIFYTATGSVKSGISFNISFDNTGLYFIRVTKSNKEVSESLYYRYSMVTQAEREAFVKAVFKTDGSDFSYIISHYIDNLELVNESNLYSPERVRNEGFKDYFLLARNLLYKDTDNKTIEDCVKLLNSACVLNMIFDGVTEKAEEFLKEDELMLSVVLEYSDIERFQKVFSKLKSQAVSAEKLSDILKWSSMLSFVQDGTALGIAKAITKYADEFFCDINICKTKNVELTRVAARFDNTNASKYYGNMAFSTAFLNAVDAESKSLITNTGTSKPVGTHGAGVSVTTVNTTPDPKQDLLDEGNKAFEKSELPEFSDLVGFDWAVGSIRELKKRNIIEGDGTGAFYPEKNVTRAEFIKMLIVALNITVVEKKDMKFLDCAGSEWYYPYVAIAYSNGIARGKDSFNFGTDDYVTREDMAVMIYNGLGVKGENLMGKTESADFDEVSEYAKKAISGVLNVGLSLAYDDGGYHPKDYATKAQMAVMINRVLNYIEEAAK